MDESALKILLDSLEKSRSSLDRWLLFWTLLVAIGVVTEVIFVIWEYRQDLHDFRRGFVHAPERPSGWLMVLGLLGAVLVAAGVSGELIVEAKIGSVETGIRKANNQLLSLLSIEAGDANQKAGEANEHAQQLKAENLRLEAVIAPRSLSLEASKRIAGACKEFHGHNVLLTSYGIDGEAAALGGQIISPLRSVGITVLDNRARNFNAGEFDIGVHIRNHFGARTENDFVSALGHALHDIGKLNVAVNDPWPKTTGVFFGGGPAYPPGTIYVDITVGVKPLPVLGKTDK